MKGHPEYSCQSTPYTEGGDHFLSRRERRKDGMDVSKRVDLVGKEVCIR